MKHCSLGNSASREDTFIFCTTAASGPASCFARRFIVPLHRAAPDFDLDDLTVGRVDVGCRCASAAFFRSQSLRHNTELRLCFQEERVLCISGGLVRNLTPDEKCISSRMHAALQVADVRLAAIDSGAPLRSGSIPDDDEAPLADSQLRGFRVQTGGILDTLKDLLQDPNSEPKETLEPEPQLETELEPRPEQQTVVPLPANRNDPGVVSIVIILSEEGQSVGAVMESIKHAALTATAGESKLNSPTHFVLFTRVCDC